MGPIVKFWCNWGGVIGCLVSGAMLWVDPDDKVMRGLATTLLFMFAASIPIVLSVIDEEEKKCSTPE